MSFSACPFCHQDVPSSTLEWHANNHFLDEELARDMELAQQIALNSTSPSRTAENQNHQMDDAYPFEYLTEEIPTTSGAVHNVTISDHGYESIEENISCLVSGQIKSTFYKVEGGLMALLRRCLELEPGNSVSILSGHVDHFQSVVSEDVGWGCGWRNIQMLCSNLLTQRPEAREVLFGGSGFVPDIPSLQRWLEIAWERDFDVFGADSFDHKIYGTRKWIGATECATLFRSFGLRARIVDFGNNKIEPSSSSVYGANSGKTRMEVNVRGKRKVETVYGPMDKFLLGRHSGVQQEDPLRQMESKYIGVRDGDDPSPSSQSSNGKSFFDRNSNGKSSDGECELNKYLTRESKGHHVLTDWVQNYFEVKKFTRSSNQRVLISERTPLYFQHDGHSRTIVGIQIKQQQPGVPQQCNLLILDPGHRTKVLETSLKENVGWQKLLKRGVHTLKKPQYQLCYIDPGVADREEMEQLKTIDSIFFEC